MSKLLLLALAFFCGGWFLREVSAEQSEPPKEGEDKMKEPPGPLKGLSEGGLYKWTKSRVEELLTELESKDTVTEDEVLRCSFFIESFERVINSSKDADEVRDTELVAQYKKRLDKLKAVEKA